MISYNQSVQCYSIGRHLEAVCSISLFSNSKITFIDTFSHTCLDFPGFWTKILHRFLTLTSFILIVSFNLTIFNVRYKLWSFINFRFQLIHYNFISLTRLLYMFRAPMCPSSGGSTIHSQQLVRCHPFCRPYSR